MQDKFDFIVIGAGSGGVRFARLMASKGKKVCIVEKNKVGGTCVIRGCIPKKLYVSASNFLDYFSDSINFGWKSNTTPSQNWTKLVIQKNKEINRLNKIYINNLKKVGVVIVQDHASFISSNKIYLKKLKKIIQAKNIIIATGSTPSMPEIPGKHLAINSDQFFEMKKLPKKISIVGSGYIALEFAFLLKNLNYDVSLIIRKKTVLNEFDPDIGQRILNSARSKKIKIYDESTVQSIKKNKKGLLVSTNKNNINADLIIFAIGRVPNIHSLNLHSAKIKLTSQQAIKVNTLSQTSNKHIYALGDVTNRKNLTPVAIREAVHLVNYFLYKHKKYLDYDKVASAIFTQPEVGSIGLGENDLKKRNVPYKVLQTEFKPLKYAFSKKINKVFIKVLYQPKTEKIFGIIYIGESAAEIIQSIAVSFAKNFTLSDLRNTIPVHPTSSEELVTLV